MIADKQAPMLKARSMVPNLFTVGNMALGFFAIVAAINGRWIAAPTAIFVAHFLDILDGRVARWMRLSSRFGMEFDSFADWISFGIAPGIMIYILALREYGKLGFLLALFYVLCGALRLVRFNIRGSSSTEEPSSSAFTGLPIPGAGGFLAVLVLLFGLVENGHSARMLSFIHSSVPVLRKGIPIVVFVLCLLMISKVQYLNFKKTHFFRPQSMVTFLITLFVCFMIYAYPQNTIFILYSSYILWGVISTAWRAYRLQKKST